MPEFQKRLIRASARVQRWKFQLVVLAALLLVGVILLGISALDWVTPLKERTTLALMGALVVFGSVFLIGQLILAWMRRPGNSPIARKVEEDHPQLMDLFNCAVDLMDRKPVDELNEIEQRVVKEAGSRTAELKMEQSLLPRPVFRQLALLGIAVCCGFFTYSRALSPVDKALHSLADLLSGKVSGLSVLPGSGEFPRGSDVAVQAHIYRGSQKAWVEYLDEDGRSKREAMRLDGNADIPEIGILKLEANVKGGGTVLHTGLPHGLLASQSIRLKGMGEADKVHRVLEVGERTLVIGSSLPQAESSAFHASAKARIQPLPAPVFYFYGIDQPLRYRVVTPELTGEWHELTSYIPPSIDKVKWKVTPPSYTQLPVFEQEGYKRLKLPEGSLLELAMEASPSEVNAFLERDGKRIEVGQDGDIFSRSWAPSKDAEYFLEVVTSGSRAFRSPGIPLELIKDNPPIIEIRKPAKDTQLHAGDMLQVDAFAVDDYGVAEARLNVRLPGGMRSMAVPVNPIRKEREISGNIDLNSLAVKDGDVFSYYMEVADNKWPEPQWSRSGVYFVEIIPPEQEPMEGPDGESPKEIPLRNLINENKRLIRETYIGMALEGEDREEQDLKVTGQAHKLKNELNRLYSENKDKLPGVAGELVLDAIKNIEQSEKFATKSELEESLTTSENSLRDLVRLSAMLRRPPSKSKKPSDSKDGKGENQAQSKPQDQEQQEQEQSLAQQFQEMQKDLKDAREILETQKGLNSRISRNARTNRTGKPNQDLANEQEGISGKTRTLRDRVYGRTGKLAHAQHFDQAEREMKDAGSRLKGDKPNAAEPHGLRASESLENAVSALETGLRDLATQMLQGLENQGKKLAGQQKSLQESTGGASAGEGEMLKNSQRGINQASDKLLSGIEQTARALEDVSPKATEALFQAASEARKGGIEKSGKRAENALNYEAFSKASKEQEKVGRELGKTAENLGDIKRKLANEGNQLLQELLRNVSQTRRGLPGMDAKEINESREGIANQMGQLEETSRNAMLQTLVQQLKHGKFSDDPSVNRSSTSQLLDQTQEVLQSFLWHEEVQDRLKRNREATVPPRKYKGQVQEYFRRLAEDTL